MHFSKHGKNIRINETEQFIEANEKYHCFSGKKFNPSIKPEEPQSPALEETPEESLPISSDENETSSETNDSSEESF